MMNDTAGQSIMERLTDSENDLILILQDSTLIAANNPFLEFFSVTSIDDFNRTFSDFADCFVLHPFYFNKTKVPTGQTWVDAISRLADDDRIVSMITPSAEPHAFLASITANIEEYTSVKFTNITTSLLKKIMIDNANIPLLSNLGFGDVADLVKLLHVKRFEQDEIIVREGSEGTAMYFIVEGSVLVQNQNVQVPLKEGDLFGEIALLKKVPRTATVMATKRCKVLELATDDFQNFINTKPDLLESIENTANSRL